MLTMNGGVGTKIRLNDRLNLSIGTGIFMQLAVTIDEILSSTFKTGVTFKPGQKATNSGTLVKR